MQPAECRREAEDASEVVGAMISMSGAKSGDAVASVG